MQATMEITIKEPTIIATMTGHLGGFQGQHGPTCACNIRNEMASNNAHVLAIVFIHTSIPAGKGMLDVINVLADISWP